MRERRSPFQRAADQREGDGRKVEKEVRSLDEPSGRRFRAGKRCPAFNSCVNHDCDELFPPTRRPGERLTGFITAAIRPPQKIKENHGRRRSVSLKAPVRRV